MRVRAVLFSAMLQKCHAEYASLSSNALFDPLFYLIVSSDTRLPERLIGYGLLNSDCHNKTVKTLLETNSQGACILPGVGYAEGFPSSSQFETEIFANESGFMNISVSSYSDGGTSFIEFSRLGNGIQFLSHLHPLLENYLLNEFDHSLLPESTGELLFLVDVAFSMLNTYFPECHEMLTMCIQELVLFRMPSQNSFAIESVPGTIFFSLPKNETLPFFIEDILHQGGHVMLDAALFSQQSSLTMERETRISKYTQDSTDSRSVYIVMHALFTEFLITEGLLRCIEQKAFDEADNFEALGRLVFSLQKYCIDYQNLSRVSDLSLLAKNIKCYLGDNLNKLLERVNLFSPSVCLEGQGYNFDLEIYRKNNPL